MTTRIACGDHAVIPWLQAVADPENFLTGVPFQVPAHELTSDPAAFIHTFDVDTEELAPIQTKFPTLTLRKKSTPDSLLLLPMSKLAIK